MCEEPALLSKNPFFLENGFLSLSKCGGGRIPALLLDKRGGGIESRPTPYIGVWVGVGVSIGVGMKVGVSDGVGVGVSDKVGV
jgi:hypothetical protein